MIVKEILVIKKKVMSNDENNTMKLIMVMIALLISYRTKNNVERNIGII